MAILIAAVLPLASAEAQRDKEDELIFRGFQYAEGIRNFRRRYGRYPNTLKEMFEMRPRTLRKLWKDPITNSDKWGLITAAGAPVTTTGTRPAGRPGSGLAPTPAPTPTVSPFHPDGGRTGQPRRPAARPDHGRLLDVEEEGIPPVLGPRDLQRVALHGADAPQPVAFGAGSPARARHRALIPQAS